MPFVLANIFQPIIDIFERVLLFFHDTVGLGWGGSIIAMTIVVRTAMLPLTIKQFRSMQALQQLSPQIKELQAKYKDDKQRLNQEMMKFYQENKVNPFGSCLPLVLQIPVFISLFYMLRKDLKVDICGPQQKLQYTADKLHGGDVASTYCHQVHEFFPGVPADVAKFLFIPDLTAPATGAVLAVLLVLYVGSQLLSSVLMSVTADKNQRYIMIALPFVFVFFILRFPAGLLVYWITTNLWTVGQQYFIRRSTGQLPTWLGGDPEAAVAGVPAAARAAAPTPKAKAKAAPSAGKDDAPPPEKAKGKAPAPESDGTGAAPPPPPRRKKKRSGRRR